MKKKDNKFAIKYIGILFFILFIGGYSALKAKNLIQGPVIDITFPKNGQRLTKPEIEVVGTTKNVSFITMNGSDIFISEKGDFKEKLLLSPGYNVVEMKVKDKFGVEEKEYIELFYLEKFSKNINKSELNKSPTEENTPS